MLFLYRLQTKLSESDQEESEVTKKRSNLCKPKQKEISPLICRRRNRRLVGELMGFHVGIRAKVAVSSEAPQAFVLILVLVAIQYHSDVLRTILGILRLSVW
jgi:hypothetical protein